ncbi:unnamed protein product [Gongylonema pulchrum]|uniref:GDSL esterase/lipase n=1 Tax=Gongylonema pulchrum TaxID=637853 RepID=A0A183ERF7_9BILA|nr:unnamed protein product [Gongylonema pulchrum]
MYYFDDNTADTGLEAQSFMEDVLHGTIDVINPLFVAERVCAGVDQSTACESQYVDDCRHWPNPNVNLPNVTQTMHELIDRIDYLSCIPQKRLASFNAN